MPSYHETSQSPEQDWSLNSELGNKLLDYFVRQRFIRRYRIDRFGLDECMAQMGQQAAKLESVGAANGIKPQLTIGIPIAESTEDPRSIKRAMEQIRKAQKHFGQPVEVVAWSNTINDDPSPSGNYDKIRSILEPFATSDLQIISAHDSLMHMTPYQSPDEFRQDVLPITVARQHMMDAIIYRAHSRNYEIDHPVLWLDADTTFVQQTAFADIDRLSRSGRIGVFRPKLDYTVDWLDGNVDNLDSATRAFIVDEIGRRKMRKTTDEKYIKDQYPEECGSFFPLSAYLLAGGLDERHAENGHLIWRVSEESKYMHPNFRAEYERLKGIGMTFCDSRGFLAPEVRIGTSARRHYRELQENGVDAVLVERGDSARAVYTMYQDNTTDRAPISSIDSERFWGIIAIRYSDLSVNDKHALAELFNKHFVNRR